MNPLMRWLCVCATLFALAGCHVVEPYKADVTKAEACSSIDAVRTGGPDAPRLWHYRSDVDMGEAPPRSVTTKGSSATRKYITRTTVTKRVETVSSSAIKIVMMVLSVVLFVCACFVLIVVLGMLKEKNFKRAGTLSLFALGGVVLATVLGAQGGSVVSIDNAGDKELDVTVNGVAVHLPPMTFTNIRVSGSELEVDTKSGSELIEHVVLHLDEDPIGWVRRALFGNGRYVYTVCGFNKYFLNTANYGKK